MDQEASWGSGPMLYPMTLSRWSEDFQEELVSDCATLSGGIFSGASVLVAAPAVGGSSETFRPLLWRLPPTAADTHYLIREVAFVSLH